MSDDSDVSVRFGADATGLRAGTAEAKSQIASLDPAVQALQASMAEMTAAMTAGFGQVAESLKLLREETAEEEAEMRGLFATVKEGVAAIGEFKEGVIGFGEAVLAAFAVREIIEFAKGMGEAAEQVLHTAQVFGFTTAEVQRLQAVFIAAGAGPEALQNSMARLDRAASAAVSGQKRASDAFKLLGVDLTLARTPAQLMQDTLQGFANIPGPERAAVAFAIFGRNIQTIAPLLGITAEGLKEFADKAEEFNAINDDAVAKGAALGAALNLEKVAMLGLGNVLAEALAPAFTTAAQGVTSMIAAFNKSYETGGLVRVGMNYLGVAVKVVESAFVALGGVISIVIDGLALGGKAFVGLGEFILACEKVVGKFYVAVFAFLPLVGDAFQKLLGVAGPVFNAIGGAIRAATEALIKFLESIPGIGPWIKSVAGATSNFFQGAVKDAENAAAAIKRIWGSDQKEELPKGGKPGTPPVLGDGADKKPKSRVSQWEEQFDEQENKQSDQNPGVLRNQEQAAATFWKNILATETLTSEERIDVQKKYYEAVKALRAQAVQETLEDARTTEQATIQSITSQLQATKAKLAEEITATNDAADHHVLSRRDAMAKVGQLINQEVQAEKTAAADILAARMALDAAIRSHYAENTPEFRKALDDERAAFSAFQAAITAADTSGNAQRAKADQESVNKTEDAFRKVATRIGDQWRSTVEGLIEGTMSWQQATIKLGEQLLDRFLQFGEQLLVNWGAQEAGKTAATVEGTTARTVAENTAHTQTLATSFATTIAQIKNSAAAAAGAAYNAMAGIPIIGPALGAAAAAATFAAVLGFGALASAAGGWGQIPEDQLAMVHKDEMVLPSRYASPLRSILDDASLPGRSGASAALAGATGAGIGAAAAFSGGSSGSGKSGDTYNIASKSLDARTFSKWADNPNHVRSATKAFTKHGGR